MASLTGIWSVSGWPEQPRAMLQHSISNLSFMNFSSKTILPNIGTEMYLFVTVTPKLLH